MGSRSKLRMSVGLFYPIAIISCYIIAIAEWGIQSIGEVFKRFMEYYQQGLEARIITELKTAR